MDRLDISQDVLLKIKGLCRQGEKTADQVLRRLLEDADEWVAPLAPRVNEPAPHHPENAPEDNRDGFTDATYGLHFPEGSEIFRTYKGRSFSARVVRRRWLLDADGRSYDSLNQLSQGVIDGNENAWMFWFTQGPGELPKRIAELRDPALVQKRPRRRKASPTHSAPHLALAADNHPAAPATPPSTVVQTQTRGGSPHPVPATPSHSGEPRQAAAGQAAVGMPWEPAKP